MNYDAIILGDGIAGLGAALGLTRYQKKVLVIGRKDLKGASTRRAAGILDPFLEMNAHSPLFRLARQAFCGYPSWLRSFGVSLPRAGYQTMGMLYLAMTHAEEKELRRRLAWQKRSGIPIRWLEPSAILKREPLVSRDLRGGLFYPSISRIQPEKLMKALTASAKKRGVRILNSQSPARLITSRNQVTGVRIGNRLFKTTIVVEAAGTWAGKDQNLRARLPVMPVRGQILIAKQGRRRISTILHSLDGGYIVPWDRGTILLGSTVERAGFRPVTTPLGLKSIRRRIEKIVPGLKNVKILTSWAGLRPFPKDRLPIIGKGPGALKGLYLAAGYYRSGILISGLAGELLAKGIVTGQMPPVLKPFSVQRFKKL